MTCEQFRDIILADRDVTPSELHAAGLHMKGCRAFSKEVAKVAKAMTPEEVEASLEAVQEMNQQLDDYLSHDPEAT